MLGKMFKSLFSSSGEGKAKSSSKATTVQHDAFRIVATPQSNNGQWQVSGRIEKDFGETTKVHTFIRADTMPDEEGAAREMVRKAKMMIDQLGDSIFD
ncbi:HlyU family transcriptional regulator [uncultured Roseibium sp.]|uniref:HlyU family transcriptional regulator n=1 Tax=uncultured Roseibium sp. TaxID=1936171 RepID=UPI0026274D71|nr:HlyU family transcriptional regulator [uncultured Roseibium sp.]